MLAPALTILLSSFLLFLVQPILAKQILPWFGGSAGVWTVCLVFFQVLLVLGYAYAHFLTRPRVGSRQYGLHIVLLVASCLTLPIVPSPFWRSASAEPTLRILGLLATTVGLPYFMLASTAPLLQRWLSGSQTSTATRQSIYRLYALSNFGSLIGLLCYPFAIEPFAPLHAQASAWSIAYAAFVASAVSYAWHRRGLSQEPRHISADVADPLSPPKTTQFAYWVGCAALGSALLVSGTNQITQNVAAVPLLWILPLTMYLLSFTICFEGRAGGGWYERRFWVTPAMLTTGAMAWALFSHRGNASLYVALPVFIVGIFLGCVMCHGELARTKPRPEYLTHFYLSLAIGGALGGLLVGLVAPNVFSGYWEMPLAVTALAALGVYCAAEEGQRQPRTRWIANIIVAVTAAFVLHLFLGGLPDAFDAIALPMSKVVEGDARWGCVALLVLCAALLQRFRFWRAVALTALACTLTFSWNYYRALSNNTRFASRNFYGALRVSESPYGAGRMRQLTHGVITHGTQVVQSPQRHMATTYYTPTSGIGRTILSAQRAGTPLRIGSVGLGAGTLAVYGKSGDLFRIYELNPAVLEIAETQFTYLKDSKARVQPILGDARLSLEPEIADGAFDKPEQCFDILSIDAFSGDAIPVHLLTSEAFAIYARVTKADGVIAFHLSNRYLNLPPVVEQLAREHGFQAALVEDRPSASGLATASDWVLVTRNASFLHEPDIAAHTVPIVRREALPLWTDQFTNLFQVLK